MLTRPGASGALRAGGRHFATSQSTVRPLTTSPSALQHVRSLSTPRTASGHACHSPWQQPALRRGLHSVTDDGNSASNSSKQQSPRLPGKQTIPYGQPKRSIPFPPPGWKRFEYAPPSYGRQVYFAYSRHRLSMSLDGKTVHFSTLPQSLRDQCTCPKCRDPSSSQKNFSLTEFPTGLHMSNITPDAEGLRITFETDIPRLANEDGQHVMVYPWKSVLRYMIDSRESLLKREFKAGLVHWDRDIMTQRARSVDYNDYIQGGDAMWEVVREVARTGLAFLHNVPEDPDSVKRITTTIAPIQSTFYGETFDVRAKPNAENVAYTSASLGLHQDLLYLNSPPRIQILHYMANSCSGGESLFSDCDRVGRLLSHMAPSSHSVKALSRNEVHYGYDANGYYYQRSRKVLNVSPTGQYVGMWWSPPFQSPNGMPWVSRLAVRGHQLLEKLLNDPSAVYERKMKPGECVLFDNRRVAHGRRAFNAQDGGSRWLRGTYISDEDFKSKLHFMPENSTEAGRSDLGSFFKQGKEPSIPGYAQARELVDEDAEIAAHLSTVHSEVGDLV